MRVTLFVAALILAYGGFLVWRLGIHQRLPLAFGPISLESIPDRAARRHGERLLYTCDCPVGWRVPALSERYSDDVSWSAVRIKSTAGYLATMLRECFDVQRGERVAILKQNHFDIHLLIAGIVRAGAIAVPLNGAFDGGGVSQYLDQVGATILFTDTATLRRLIAEGGGWGVVRTVVIADRPQPAPTLPPTLRVVWIEDALSVVTHESAAIRRGADDPMYLVHSSGTTGFPKAVILRNDAQSHAVRGWLCYVHLSRTRDRGYVAVPNNHQAVILTFNSSLLLGLRVHWDSSYGLSGFDPAHVISALARGRFTAYFGFPITYTQLKEVDLSRYDLSRMRIWASTADASHAAIQRAFVALGGAFRSVGLPVSGSVYLDAQGSSEVGTPSVLRYVTRFSRHFDRRVGRPGSTPFGPRVRIARDGVVVRRGEVGRLEVKGRTVFKAYWNNPATTSEAIRDGWFFTGDVARQDRDGHLIQLDREVDVIRTAHGPVYSLLIEEKIHQHPAVFDACVYGERLADGTQAPAAAVALRAGHILSAPELRSALNARLDGRQQLSTVDVIDWTEFPIGLTGKTLKRVFRERSERSSRRPMGRATGAVLA